MTPASARRATGPRVGVAGLAPGFIEVEASLYLGDGGRTALRLTTARDLLLTQRLVLQPELELEAYGKDDPERLIGVGPVGP